MLHRCWGHAGAWGGVRRYDRLSESLPAVVVSSHDVPCSRNPSRARQRRAARDLARRMAQLDRLDREYGLGAMPSASTSRARRGSRSRGPVLPVLMVTVMTAVLLAAIVALSPADHMLAIRRLLGFDDDRLAAAPRIPHGIGSYEFLHTQRGSDKPVAYDPCRPIEVVVNPEGAPDNYDELVETGLEHTRAATGLKFIRVGFTSPTTAMSPPAASPGAGRS